MNRILLKYPAEHAISEALEWIVEQQAHYFHQYALVAIASC